jgi:hypothetical protein
METRLMGELTRTGDPRVIDDGKFYETPPMSGPVNDPDIPAAKKGKAKTSK